MPTIEVSHQPYRQRQVDDPTADEIDAGWHRRSETALNGVTR